MARPPAKELTERELEIMHVFWRDGELTASAVRDRLADGGRDLAYTTVATLVRILVDKGFLKQTNRPAAVRLSAVAIVCRRIAANRRRRGRARVSSARGRSSCCS